MQQLNLQTKHNAWDMKTENNYYNEAYLHGIQQLNLRKSPAQVGQQVGDQFPLDSNVSRRVGRLLLL